MKRIWVVLILVLSFLGLADSLYLAQHEITGTPLLCNIQNLTGCNTVANSPYSVILGIPLAEYGVLFYTILFVLAALELVLFDRLLRRILQGLSLVCLIASLYFLAIQIFLIGAFCIYCTASAIITLLVFIFATRIEPLRRRELPVQSGPVVSPESSTSSSDIEKGTHLPMPPTTA